MILVTVGNHTAGFERLTRAMDELAANIDEDIIAQIGSTQYLPSKLQWFRFIEYQEMLTLIKKARIVVCHGGAGTILDAIRNGKPLVILPRLKKYGEAFDDHELELAKAISLDKRAILVRDVHDLLRAINDAPSLNMKKNDDRHDLTEFLRGYIIQEE
jgi:beta-1,4-N-acetylglucosaminyltransferase